MGKHRSSLGVQRCTTLKRQAEREVTPTAESHSLKASTKRTLPLSIPPSLGEGAACSTQHQPLAEGQGGRGTATFPGHPSLCLQPGGPNSSGPPSKDPHRRAVRGKSTRRPGEGRSELAQKGSLGRALTVSIPLGSADCPCRGSGGNWSRYFGPHSLRGNCSGLSLWCNSGHRR